MRKDALLDASLRPYFARRRIRHISGPASVEYGDDEVLLMTIVWNGQRHIRDYLNHHFRIGVRHVVLLDNQSTDGTVEIAREYDRVTILQTDLPYRAYENTLKRHLARRFSRNRWNLIADVDERFDYPGSDRVGLRDLIGYANRRGYTAVVCQMLDLFPDCTLGALGGADEAPMREAHSWYDLSNVRRSEYVYGVPSNREIQMHWDGIRNTLFGSTHGLTKAALVRVEDGMNLFADWHHVPQARLADFSCVLLHYPFAAGFESKAQEAVETMRYGYFSATDYRRFWKGLQHRPDTPMRQSTSRRWRGAESLLEEGFLTASPSFRQWVTGKESALPVSPETEND